jgi:hypothetical protein
MRALLRRVRLRYAMPGAPGAARKGFDIIAPYTFGAEFDHEDRARPGADARSADALRALILC